MILRSTAVLVLTSAVAFAGCGSSDDGGGASDASARPARAPTSTSPPPVPTVPRSLLPPASVPQEGSGKADATSVRVISAWLAALQDGKITQAAKYFAQSAHVQNGTPVLTLRTFAARVAFNAGFPCGAESVLSQHADKGFTIVTFKLTKRRNAECGSGVGGQARSAIRVSGHRIAEWYRLPDDGNGTPQAPSVTDPGIGVV